MADDEMASNGPDDGPDCPWCGEAFDSLAAMQEHIEDEHDDA